MTNINPAMKDVEELCAGGTVLRCVHYTTKLGNTGLVCCYSETPTPVNYIFDYAKQRYWIQFLLGSAATATITCCFDSSILRILFRECHDDDVLIIFGKSWNAEGYMLDKAKKGSIDFQLWNDLRQMLLSLVVFARDLF